MNKDEHLNRFAADREIQDMSQTSIPPWIPRIEGREDLTVTVSDASAKDSNEKIQFGGRWTHIESEGEGMRFREFKTRAIQAPNLDDVDQGLIGHLLDDVQESHEQKFVYGRYLDPIALRCVDEDLDSKTATFVSLPAFSTEYPRMHTTDRDFEGHPVRALL